MAELTLEDLLRRVNQDPTLQAVFSGAKSIQTVGNRHHITAAALTSTYGTVTGTVASVQGYRDGSALKVVEVNTTPIDQILHYDNVSSFQELFISAKYSGTAAHWIKIQLQDGITSATWHTVDILVHDPSAKDLTDMQGRTVKIPNCQKFINSSRRVSVKFLHNDTLAPGHELWIDYVALVV